MKPTNYHIYTNLLLVCFFVCLVLHDITSKLSFAEFLLLAIVVFISLLYFIQMTKLSPTEPERFENNQNTIVETNPTMSRPKCISQLACEDEMMGYIPISIWQEISDLPSKVSEKILPPLDKLTNVFKKDLLSDQRDPDDDTQVDEIYVNENIPIYKELKVIQESDNNVDVEKLNELNKTLDAINTFLFHLQKHYKPEYQKLMQRYTTDPN